MCVLITNDFPLQSHCHIEGNKYMGVYIAGNNAGFKCYNNDQIV